jgi:hypothetical protein
MIRLTKAKRSVKHLKEFYVSGTNITQIEAAQRSEVIKVTSYKIDLDLTTGAETFLVKTTVNFAGLKPGATTFIDCVGKRVISAKLNGADFDPKFDGETVFLPALAADNVLEIEHEGIYSNSGEGLHRFVDPADNEVYLYTQFETGDARRMYACFDQPDQKATFTISTITPKHWEVISNYGIEATKDVDGDRKHIQFATSQRLLPVPTNQFMMNTKARRQSLWASTPVNLSSSMLMLRIFSKLPSKALPTLKRLLVWLTHLVSTTRSQLLNTTGARWRTSAA